MNYYGCLRVYLSFHETMKHDTMYLFVQVITDHGPLKTLILFWPLKDSKCYFICSFKFYLQTNVYVVILSIHSNYVLCNGAVRNYETFENLTVVHFLQSSVSRE